MGVYLTVALIAIGLAAAKITTETAAEYLAMYVVEQDELGASTSDATAGPSDDRSRTAAGRLSEADVGPLSFASLPPPGATREGGSSRGRAQAAVATPMGREPDASATTPSGSLLAPDRSRASSGSVERGVVQEPRAAADDPLLSLIGDTPHRRPDGTVFLPIAAQRVFGLRTVLGERATVPITVEMPGRIIVNPSSSALVQVSQDGFVETIEGRFPAIGQQVSRGELLAYLRPHFTTLEQAQVRQRVQELTAQIDLARKRIARLEEVTFVRYRANKIEEIRVEMEGWRRQLVALQSSIEAPSEIRARANGVISRVAATVGQFLHPGDTLFEIVDPTQLWVEATAFEPDIAARIKSATAITADGDRVRLRFVGGGLSLRHQAIPLQFEIVQPAPGLTVDKPVTVVVQTTNGSVAGVRIPRRSLVRTSDGRQLIWERRSAEGFVAHHVSYVSIDANAVLVTSDLVPSSRIVTEGAGVLTQVR